MRGGEDTFLPHSHWLSSVSLIASHTGQSRESEGMGPELVHIGSFHPGSNPKSWLLQFPYHEWRNQASEMIKKPAQPTAAWMAELRQKLRSSICPPTLCPLCGPTVVWRQGCLLSRMALASYWWWWSLTCSPCLGQESQSGHHMVLWREGKLLCARTAIQGGELVEGLAQPPQAPMKGLCVLFRR